MDQCNYRNSDSWSWLSVSGGPIYHLVVRKIISGLHTRSVLSYTKLEEKTATWSLVAFTLRDNNNLQQVNRRLERKLKEMKMQGDEERLNLQSQTDQVDTSLTTNKTLLWCSLQQATRLVILYLVFPRTLQLTQRLKTAKRQMDEAEEEIERLEHAKKKLQRELDEQMEANEQLHSQLSAVRNEMRWSIALCL